MPAIACEGGGFGRPLVRMMRPSGIDAHRHKSAKDGLGCRFAAVAGIHTRGSMRLGDRSKMDGGNREVVSIVDRRHPGLRPALAAVRMPCSDFGARVPATGAIA